VATPGDGLAVFRRRNEVPPHWVRWKAVRLYGTRSERDEQSAPGAGIA